MNSDKFGYLGTAVVLGAVGFAFYRMSQAKAATSPPPSSPSNLPFGFSIGDKVLVAPSEYFNPSFPVPGQDTTTPVSAVVVDPVGANLTPFGIPSITVRATDLRVFDTLDKIVPLTSVRKI